jgi:putative ABC transport system ATP-binding protein
MTALLETVDLKKTYRVGKVDVEALRGVNVRIRAGEFSAIIGPSGSGKSTLMHLLGAMTTPTSGHVSIEGRDIAGMDDGMRTEVRRKSLGFVFQRFNLLPTLTARANIEVARWIGRGAGGAADRSRLDAVLHLLRIEDKLDRRPSELSGGEQQRVAIARAVANHPAILLADEPTGALDSKNSEIVLNMFRELNASFNQTIILVTHNPELASRAHRIVEMRDGLVVRDTGATAVGA